MQQFWKKGMFLGAVFSLIAVAGAECDYSGIVRETGGHLLMRTIQADDLMSLMRVDKEDVDLTPLSARGADRLTLLGEGQSHKWPNPLVVKGETMFKGDLHVEPNEWRAGLLFSPEILNKSDFFVDSSATALEKLHFSIQGEGVRRFDSKKHEPEELREALRILEEEQRRANHARKEKRAVTLMTVPVPVRGPRDTEAEATTHFHIENGVSLADLRGIWAPAPLFRLMSETLLSGAKSVSEVKPRPHHAVGLPLIEQVDVNWYYRESQPNEKEALIPYSNNGNWFFRTPDWKEVAEQTEDNGGTRLLQYGTFFFGSMFPSSVSSKGAGTPNPSKE